MKFLIEKNVPLPTLTDSYPFKEMEVGDSFFVPHNFISTDALRMQAYKAAKYLGRQFKTKRVEGGCRVWRVEDKS